jgi:hypothetical protein
MSQARWHRGNSSSSSWPLGLVSDVLWLFVPAAFRFAVLTQAWFVPLKFALAWTASRANRSRVGAAPTVLGVAIPLFNLSFVWRLFTEAAAFLLNRGVHAAWFRTSASQSSLRPLD